MTQRFSFILLFLLLSLQVLLAQQIKVSGVVISEDDSEPIIGATVLQKGTTNGTITDFDGKFTLDVERNAILQISYVGMKMQELQAQANMRILLSSDAQSLEEVVVVAYGTAKKESLTGAVSSIDTRDIEIRPVSNVAGVLEGKAAGVQVNNSFGEPGSNPEIRIRGFGSINGSSTPLYVLDGVPFVGNMSDLNPNDIESLSVLKDAASSALYGNRAANGVVLITTKKGKSDKLRVRGKINQGVFQRGIPEYDRVGADDFMEVMWTGYRNSLMSSSPDKYPSFAEANAEAGKSLITDILEYNIYNKPSDQLFDENGKLVAGAQILDGYRGDLDWYKPVERTGYRQDYNLSVDAANDKTNYYFSMGYTDEKGYIKMSDWQRLTANAKVNFTPKNWFTGGLSFSGSHQIANKTTGGTGDTGSYKNPFMFARQIAPIYPIHLHNMEDGSYILDLNGNKQFDGGGDPYKRPQYGGRHMIWETELDMDKRITDRIQGQGIAEFKFLNDFSFKLVGDMSIQRRHYRSFNNPLIGDGQGNKGRAKSEHLTYKNYTFQQQLFWKKKINEHELDILVGHENYSYDYTYQYGYKTTQIFDGNTELINFTNITSLYSYLRTYRLESYLSRIRYNYDNKYFLDGSFRRDGSSRFHPDNRWGNFWSLGGSWSINRESFMETLEHVFNSLKLRASYGEVGNDASVEYYGYMDLYDLYQNNNVGALYKSQNGAPDIKWETTASLGVALEGRLYDRANFSVEYFDKRSIDLLFNVYLPLSAGATSTAKAEATVARNIGSISNRGWEIAFDVDAIQKRDFNWNIGINATFLKNKVTKLPEQNRKDGIIDGRFKIMEGHSRYDFWLYQFAGVDQMTGNSLYLPDLDTYYIGDTPVENKQKLPDEWLVNVNGENYTRHTSYAKRDWSGKSIPTVQGAITTSFSYKDFDLSALFTYSLGGKIYDISYRSLMNISSPYAVHKDALKSWNGIPEGMTENSANRIDPNGIPVIDFNRATENNAASSTRWLHNRSYFGIKNITLSYRVPSAITRKIDLSGLSFNLSLENLATFSSLKGMNPQMNWAGSSDNAFVTARVMSLGININL